MSRRLPLFISLIVVIGASPRLARIAAQQTRGVVAHPTAGTASISGVVVDDEQPARPVRRAVVTLSGDGLRPDRGAITDDEGWFALRGLPAGRFTLMAERGAFVTSVYGAKRPGRPGTPITLADGQRIQSLQVRLWRGAVVSGVLRDGLGAPLPNTAVAAVPVREVTPTGPTLGNNSQATTNDLGEFRIFGLEPGTYIIRAGSPRLGRPVIAASEAEIDAMLAALAARKPETLPAGAIRPPTTSIQPAGTVMATAPIYFPGTPVVADATPITLVAGEERDGLDFAVEPVRTSTIRGTVVGPDGTPVPQAFIQLAIVTRPEQFAGAVPAPVTITAGPDGTFTLGPISPGDYRLLARGAVPQSSGPGDSFWWATRAVPIAGDDEDLGRVTLEPGMTFSGRVVFDSGATLPGFDLAGLRVEMQAESLSNAPSQTRGGGPPGARFLRPAVVRADGAFEVTDLVPDEYRLTVSGSAISDSGWWLRAAMRNGRDLLDAPLRLEPNGNISGVTLVLSDRHTELSGTLTTAGGTAASDLFVAAYPADAALRTPHSRRVQAVRPDSGGRFVFRNLPAGDYLLCALMDVDDGAWNEPGFFDGLIAASVRITLAEGEKRVRDLQLGGR